MKIWYVSRSYYPTITGGTIIRKAQVDFLIREGFTVEVVTPNYHVEPLELEDLITRLPISRISLRVGMVFQRLGIFEDYLYLWVKKSYKLLIDRVKSDDIVFSTSGGELGCIMLGSLLKKSIGCKHVVNFHDPLDYSLVNGKVIDHRFHASREYAEFKYLNNADLVITSSHVNQVSLQKKYPQIASKVVNQYFGYVESSYQPRKRDTNKLCIAYGGAFADEQSPYILAQAGSGMPNVELAFIGHWNTYSPLFPYIGKCRFVSSLSYKEYLVFMAENVDVGFVSLSSEYLGACVPSKIFEYINLGIPILGALPDGDGKDIINNNGYGIAVEFNDIHGLRSAIEELKDPHNLGMYRAAIARDRNKWAMGNRIKKVVNWLQNI